MLAALFSIVVAICIYYLPDLRVYYLKYNKPKKKRKNYKLSLSKISRTKKNKNNITITNNYTLNKDSSETNIINTNKLKLKPYVPPPKYHFLTSKSPQWQADQDCQQCNGCVLKFNIINRRHHCRICGKIFCKICSAYVIQSKRSCKECFKKHLRKKKLGNTTLEEKSDQNDDWLLAANSLNGTYKLDTLLSDDITPLMKFYGLSSFLIKAAKMLSYTTTLSVTKSNFLIHTTSKLKDINEDYLTNYTWFKFQTQQGIKLARAKIIKNFIITHIHYKPGYMLVCKRFITKNMDQNDIKKHQEEEEEEVMNSSIINHHKFMINKIYLIKMDIQYSEQLINNHIKINQTAINKSLIEQENLDPQIFDNILSVPNISIELKLTRIFRQIQ